MMRYIVLEGIDGAGKSSVQRFLAEEIVGRGLKACRLHDTTGTPAAKKIYDIVTDGNYYLLPGTRLDLFNAARRETLRVVEDNLSIGAYIVGDRSWRSSVAYQGFGEGMDIDEVYKSASNTAWIKADMTIVLDVPVDIAFERMAARGEKASWFEEQGREYFERVREGFLWQVARDQLAVVDASLSKIQVYKQVLALVEPLLKG